MKASSDSKPLTAGEITDVSSIILAMVHGEYTVRKKYKPHEMTMMIYKQSVGCIHAKLVADRLTAVLKTSSWEVIVEYWGAYALWNPNYKDKFKRFSLSGDDKKFSDDIMMLKLGLI